MSGSLTIAGMAAGLASGQKTIGPVSMIGTHTVGQITDAALIAGDNTFPVPAGAVAVAIFPGNSPSATVTIRTNLNPGDAGLPVTPYSGVGWAAFPLAGGVTALILNASTAVNSVELSFI